MRSLTHLLGNILVAILASACSSEPPPGQVAVKSADSSDAEILARVGDDTITLSEIRKSVGDELDQLQTKYRQQRYKVLDAALQDVVRDRVLSAVAKEQGKTVDEVLLAAAGSLEPTDADVSAFYETNKARFGGQTLNQLRMRIVEYLRLERRRTAVVKVEDRLRKAGKLVVLLEPYRFPLNNQGAPWKGAPNSSVTLVEFSDFQCPFCRGFVPTLKKIEETYGTRVKIVYRQYPIPSLHQFAEKAAEASLCANEQGKFWEIHDLMFQEQDRLNVDDLKAKAGRLGLNRGRFDACLDAGRYTQQVANDVREGTRAGVTGTPAFFINGVLLEGGAVSFEVVARALDEELERGKAGAR